MRVKGLQDSIYPTKPPRNYRDAMSREDNHEWAEAYMAEYEGFLTQGTLKIVKPIKGAKIVDTTTRADYKVTNGLFEKRKIRLCVCGNQQEGHVHYNLGDLYALVMNLRNHRKSDSRSILQLEKTWMCTKLTPNKPFWMLKWARRSYTSEVRIGGPSRFPMDMCFNWWRACMELGKPPDNGTSEFHAVNNEKTMFVKWPGTDWIMYGVFVDDMMHTSTRCFRRRYDAHVYIHGNVERILRALC